jgi:hypothetical protein
VIEGPVDLAGYVREFEPLLLRRGGDILRADRIFLEASGRSALVEMLVVEAGRKQPFYAKISLHDRGAATVRVDPLTHPERSRGVKEIVARIGADLLARTPGASVGAANVELPGRPR